MDNLLIVFMILFMVSFYAAILFFTLWQMENEYSDLLERVNKDYVKRWIEWEKGPKKTKNGDPIPPPIMLGIDRF